ncbi:MAG: Rdx family protein [Deltaproteobacteria bacterium]|nr:Rdx family protein [Deltaproteobacteria bacterium]
MAAELKRAFDPVDIELVPGGRGDFIVTVDGRERWNKRQMDDEFPDPQALIAELGKRTAP